MHTSQLRQPGDYLKNNRTITTAHSHVHSGTQAEQPTNSEHLYPNHEREQLVTATRRVETETEGRHTLHKQEQGNVN